MASMSLKTHPAVEIIHLGETRWQVAGASRRHTISAPAGLMESVVAACNGTSTRQAIVDALRHDHDSVKVSKFLDFLLHNKYLVESETADSGESLLDSLDLQSRLLSGVTSRTIETRSLLNCTVDIIGASVIADKVREQLADIGCQLNSSPDATSDSHADIAVACCDRLDHGFFRHINRQSIARQRPTLFVALDGSHMIVGPFINPPATACFECFHTRLRANSRHLAELDARTGTRTEDLRTVPASRLLARWSASVAVAKLAAHAAGLQLEHPAGEILEIDGFSGRTEIRRLIKLPRCPICGPGGINRPRVMIYENEAR